MDDSSESDLRTVFSFQSWRLMAMEYTYIPTKFRRRSSGFYFLIEIEYHSDNPQYQFTDGSTLEIYVPRSTLLFRTSRQSLVKLRDFLTRMNIGPETQDDLTRRMVHYATVLDRVNTENQIIPIRVDIDPCVEFFDGTEHVLAESNDYIRFVPATNKSIRALENVRIEDDHDFSKQCIICQEKLSNGDKATKMPCSHVYHGDEQFVPIVSIQDAIFLIRYS